MLPNRPPHPIPYQGSKRLLARRILSVLNSSHFDCLYEPFGGSGAITIAAASANIAERYELADTLEPLTSLWSRILSSRGARRRVQDHLDDAPQRPPKHYAIVRDEFNANGGAARLLCLLARCVKNAPRFNANGVFNQSADHRQCGVLENMVEHTPRAQGRHAVDKALQLRVDVHDAWVRYGAQHTSCRSEPAVVRVQVGTRDEARPPLAEDKRRM